VIYIIAIVIAALYALAALSYGYAFAGVGGLLGALIVSPIVFFFGVVIARVYMELIIVIFRAAESLSEIARNTKR
jgi:uncharacterized membrane protein